MGQCASIRKQPDTTDIVLTLLQLEHKLKWVSAHSSDSVNRLTPDAVLIQLQDVHICNLDTNSSGSVRMRQQGKRHYLNDCRNLSRSVCTNYPTEVGQHSSIGITASGNQLQSWQVVTGLAPHSVESLPDFPTHTCINISNWRWTGASEFWLIMSDGSDSKSNLYRSCGQGHLQTFAERLRDTNTGVIHSASASLAFWRG